MHSWSKNGGNNMFRYSFSSKENKEKEDKEPNKTEYLSLIKKSKVRVKHNQAKYTSVSFVIIKLNIEGMSLHTRSQFI